MSHEVHSSDRNAGLYDEYLMLYNLDLNKKYRSGGTWRSRESAVELLGILQQTLKSDVKTMKSPPKK